MFAFTSRLIDAASMPRVGTVGDGYDNARAATTIGLYKAEKIHREGPGRTLTEVELATLEWVDWYNHELLQSRRLQRTRGGSCRCQRCDRVSFHAGRPVRRGHDQVNFLTRPPR